MRAIVDLIRQKFHLSLLELKVQPKSFCISQRMVSKHENTEVIWPHLTAIWAVLCEKQGIHHCARKDVKHASYLLSHNNVHGEWSFLNTKYAWQPIRSHQLTRIKKQDTGRRQIQPLKWFAVFCIMQHRTVGTFHNIVPVHLQRDARYLFL